MSCARGAWMMNLLCLLGFCVAIVASARAPMGWDASQSVSDYGLSVEMTDFNWNEKLAEFGDTPVFFHFFAPWDGFCKKIAPQWKELGDIVNAPDSEHKFIVGHVNGVENSDITEAFGITKFPSFKVMHGGQMYLYNISSNEHEVLLHFGNEGWKTAQHRTIGGSSFDILLDAVESAQDILENDTLGAVPILGAGVLGGFGFGFLLARMIFGCAGSRSKKSKSKKKKKN